MKTNKDATFIILILFILVGLSYNNKNDNLFTKKTDSVITTNKNTQTTYSNKETSENIKKTEKEIEELQEKIKEENKNLNKSKYSEKISLSGISGLYDKNPDKQYMTIHSYLDKNEKVNITGWYLKSELTKSLVYIGKASLLPFPYTKQDSDIILEKGDKVIINKGFSPIGISFRTNKCVGFFEEDKTFTPNLNTSCPLVEDRNLPKFSTNIDRNEECLEIIENLSRCETVNSEFLRDLPDTVNQFCKDYLETQVNYNACVAYHFDDTDFPGNEYRIYLNKFGPLWRERHDTINLYDKENKIVGTIEY